MCVYVLHITYSVHIEYNMKCISAVNTAIECTGGNTLETTGSCYITAEKSQNTPSVLTGERA